MFILFGLRDKANTGIESSL